MSVERVKDGAAQPVLANRNNRFFVPRDGIDREVITSDICRYLGNDALVRPGTLEKADGAIAHGYFITAYRNLTTPMIDDLKATSALWEAERRKKGMSNTNDSNGFKTPVSSSYKNSDTHQRYDETKRPETIHESEGHGRNSSFPQSRSNYPPQQYPPGSANTGNSSGSGGYSNYSPPYVQDTRGYSYGNQPPYPQDMDVDMGGSESTPYPDAGGPPRTATTPIADAGRFSTAWDRDRSPRLGRDSREYRDPREGRDSREFRDVRDQRDPRDIRDPRMDYSRDSKGSRDMRDVRDVRDMPRVDAMDPRIDPRDLQRIDPMDPRMDPRADPRMDPRDVYNQRHGAGNDAIPPNSQAIYGAGTPISNGAFSGYGSTASSGNGSIEYTTSTGNYADAPYGSSVHDPQYSRRATSAISDGPGYEDLAPGRDSHMAARRSAQSPIVSSGPTRSRESDRHESSRHGRR